MITRVTEQMKYFLMTENLFKVQNKNGQLMEQMASQKRINRPSDDPLGTSTVLDLRTTRTSLENYGRNIENAESWLSVTESKLSSAADILIEAKGLSLSQSSATASEDSRKSAATSISSLIDELRAIANSKFGGRYLFAGSRADAEPFSTAPGLASIGAAVASDANVFDGTVTASGAYTADRNKTYVVRIAAGGALAATTYQVSSDGGKTWGAVKTGLVGDVAIGDGVNIRFQETGTEQLTGGDLFSVQTLAAGYYQGNGEEAAVEIGKGNTFRYGITGESVFTDANGGSVDVFAVLDDLKTALETNNATGISSQIDLLQEGYDQTTRQVSRCGSRMEILEAARNSYSALDLQLTELMSNAEDTDVSQLLIEYKSHEIALEACYSMAAQIGNNSIIQFLK